MKIRGILLTEEKYEDKTIEDDIATYYELLDCDCIDIITRKIGGKSYDIICDDEGLLKEKAVRAICYNFREILVGNLFICGAANDEGELTSLTDEDVNNILEEVFLHPNLGPILEYAV